MRKHPANSMLLKAARVAACALAASLLSPALAGAEEGLIWTQKSSGDLSTLSYGPLDPAAEPLFLLSCFSGMEIAVLDVHKEVGGVKPGQPLTIEFSSAKAQAPVAGEVSVNDATGKTFGEASDIKVQPVLEVLRDPGPVTVKMGDTTATLSEQGRDLALAEFAKNCTLK